MMSARVFHIRMSECRYRLAAENVTAHAPKKPGVYRILSYDEKLSCEVLYVGLGLPTVHHALADQVMGNVRPTAAEFAKGGRELYFEFSVDADVESPEEYKDIAAALVRRDKPRMNSSAPPATSGRHGRVEVREEG
ncbi:MAG: hypothetical protein WC728_00920 [Elusimicrobiota bacterium]